MAARSRTKQQCLNETLNEKACAYIAETMLPLLEEALGEHCQLGIKPNEKDQGHIIRVEYPKTADTGGLLPYIQLETGPLASWLPHSKHTIMPYAAEAFPGQFDDPSCLVRAIDAERTFWEKATILHQEAHRRMNSPFPVNCSTSSLAGSGGFNRRQLIPSTTANTPTERRGYNFPIRDM